MPPEVPAQAVRIPANYVVDRVQPGDGIRGGNIIETAGLCVIVRKVGRHKMLEAQVGQA